MSPNDIDVFICSHLHNDHCENDYKCVNAIFYVHEKELERIHNPHPLDFRYLEDYIDDVEKKGRIKTITGDVEIAPGIRAIHTPAHTEGGMTILITTPGGEAAITGFCVIMENFFPPKEITGMEMEVIPPGTHVNIYEAYDIVLKVKNAAHISHPSTASRAEICSNRHGSLRKPQPLFLYLVLDVDFDVLSKRVIDRTVLVF